MICWMHRWQIGATAAGGNICHQPRVRQTRHQLRRCHVGIWIRRWWHMMRQIVVSRCRTDCNGSEVEPVATLWLFSVRGFLILWSVSSSTGSFQKAMKWCWLRLFWGYWRLTVSCSFQITQSFRGSPSLLFCDLRRPKMPILNKQARYLDEREEYWNIFLS